jgi:hypothetical protein
MGDTSFWGKRDQDGQQQAELKKTLQKFVKLCVKIIGW